EYSDIFTGLEASDRPYNIEVDSSLTPIIQPQYNVPYSRMKPFQMVLQSLQEKGVIADVDCPTSWVHNLVITEKIGNLCLCIDPELLNRAIKSEKFQISTTEDVQTKFAGAKVFSVVDMRDSY
ncbi:hypothetical protein CAPTEDRAFT_93168, partial [Capitella teleta]|uniref:Uncharacterized protein n=1 Tax=Capitella teleta TaxID=283909 RepID=X2BBW0_CAPTE